ncbi:hemopexin [Kryptolebias marmoratus]|uniref:hemopexin n=1 Tax=Kryptolebias marmoratus TaxID=37003 RepID=UPI000D53038C|nr:hemopexin [Kryptolebias marmoratus]
MHLGFRIKAQVSRLSSTFGDFSGTKTMDLVTKTLFLCLAFALREAAPVQDSANDAAVPDRCTGIEFDAITPDDKGNALFFKDGHIWKGFHGPAQLSSEHFKELTGHVDAAFRMHNTGNPDDHDHIYLFMGDKVFSYFNQSLEEGYPKQIQEDFPGVPAHLDAAVECPKGECIADSVLFFKGQDVYVYDITTKTVKTKAWSHLPSCTSIFRWLEHYYCFHGHNFTRFHPVTGEVVGEYPKDTRNYFMRCPNFGHGSNHKPVKCSEVKLDAATTDDTGRTYFFSGSSYMRQDTHRDGFHNFPIIRGWKEVTNGVDAVFSYTNKIYLIKGDQIYIYKADAHFTLIEGYPKTVKEELGIEGHVDAAFVCPTENVAHIFQGNRMRDVDLTATPRIIVQDRPLPLSDIDAGLCGADGIKLFKGSQYYSYESPMILAMGRIAPRPAHITSAMMACED